MPRKRIYCRLCIFHMAFTMSCSRDKRLPYKNSVFSLSEIIPIKVSSQIVVGKQIFYLSKNPCGLH